MPQQKKVLLCAGMFLFLCGLLNGALVQEFTNPRAGLSAHLTGVQNGMFLLIVGLLWDQLGFTRAWQWTLTSALTIYSLYAVWVALLLSAIAGTSRATPIAGAGFAGSALAERMVEIPLLTCAGAGVASAALLLFGLISYASPERGAAADHL